MLVDKKNNKIELPITEYVNEDIKILIIDDSEEIRVLLETILSIKSFQTITTDNANEALDIIDNSIDTIILDLMMPGLSGEEFIKIFRKKKNFSHIPIVVLTAKDNLDKEISNVIESGANDYIKKPFSYEEFVSKVKVHAKTKKLTDNLINTNIKLTEAYNELDQLLISLKYSATHDNLTDIYNRGTILDLLQNDIKRSKRINTPLSVIMFDIDFFKKINDTYGHLVGDEILKGLIDLLKKSIREIDLFGRYGGEEFFIILPNTDIKNGQVVIKRIIECVRKHVFKTKKGNLKITISIGLSQFQQNDSIDTLLERVDSAVYEAKNSGRDCFKIK